MEAQIKESLNSLLEGIKRSDDGRVAGEMARLDALLAKGRPELNPQLIHFLERRSYAKALQFLGGASDIPAGACGGRPA
jgi:hypothetical protein